MSNITRLHCRDCHVHKHKKHSHEGGRKHESVNESTTTHKTITLDSIPDSLLPHRSLVNYIDDCPKLLDEVFSIFSEDEISSMLPDILKGIELGEVKKLCIDQLKGMDSVTIKDIIQSSSDGAGGIKSGEINTEGDDKPTSHDGSHEPCEEMDDHSPLEQLSPVKEMDTSSIEVDTLSTSCATNKGSDRPAVAASTSIIETAGVGEDSIELSATVGDDIDRELTLNVSLNRSTSGRDTTKTALQGSQPSTEPIVPKNKETSSSKPAQPDNSNKAGVNKAEVEVSSQPVTSQLAINGEAVVLTDLELQLRQKALQSQLKKRQHDKMLNELRAKEELLLRQKALQSMLAAKKKKP